MKLHIILAAIILPGALMFLITGALYTWGEKGSYEVDSYHIQLKQPLQNNLAGLLTLVTDELTKREIAHPTGAAKVKQLGSSFYFEWTGAKHDIHLEPTDNAKIAKLKIKTTTWHRFFVQLHKAKAGQFFKVYAAVVALGLMTLFITGFIMAWQLKKYRPLLLSSTATGLVLFILMAAFS
ncbi:MAG: hypothetical protein GQ582_07850 [Methyloprofundus sp.]|nr:hypothetical protein [Methyloprofundus sp.]